MDKFPSAARFPGNSSAHGIFPVYSPRCCPRDAACGIFLSSWRDARAHRRVPVRCENGELLRGESTHWGPSVRETANPPHPRRISPILDTLPVAGRRIRRWGKTAIPPKSVSAGRNEPRHAAKSTCSVGLRIAPRLALTTPLNRLVRMSALCITAASGTQFNETKHRLGPPRQHVVLLILSTPFSIW